MKILRNKECCGVSCCLCRRGCGGPAWRAAGQALGQGNRRKLCTGAATDPRTRNRAAEEEIRKSCGTVGEGTPARVLAGGDPEPHTPPFPQLCPGPSTPAAERGQPRGSGLFRSTLLAPRKRHQPPRGGQSGRKPIRTPLFAVAVPCHGSTATNEGPLPRTLPALPAHITAHLANSQGPVTPLNNDIFHHPSLAESEFKGCEIADGHGVLVSEASPAVPQMEFQLPKAYKS